MKETKTIRLLATSDVHGKFLPWMYSLNMESPGSAAQLSTAIRQYRTENTLLVEAGDLIEGNSSELFLDDPVHPMVQAYNRMNYDLWVTGNHEYTFGMEILKKTIADLHAECLTGNVFFPDGTPLAKGYTIREINGIRAAVIGMTSPNINRWEKKNMDGCTATDALAETRKILEEIRGRYDVLIGVFHEGLENECNTENTGVTDICNACPEFDIMVSAHEHRAIPELYINNVLVIQNSSNGRTMSCIDLSFEQEDGRWRLTGRKPELIDVCKFEPDPELVQLFEPYHKRAKDNAESQVGTLVGGPLTPPDEINGVAQALLEPTPLIDLINRVQMYYGGTEISAAALGHLTAKLPEGIIRECDLTRIYAFTNTLCRVSLTGAQMKRFMEYSAEFFNKFQPGDLTISFNPAFQYYLYMMFAGVNYEINISAEPGSRIEHLTYPDGRPVNDTDVLHLAVSEYCAGACLLTYGTIFHEGEELPILEESGIHSELGCIREMLKEYIMNVRHGVLEPVKPNNWKLTGYSWDSSLRNRAVQALNRKNPVPSGLRSPELPSRAMREEDLPPEEREEQK